MTEKRPKGVHPTVKRVIHTEQLVHRYPGSGLRTLS